MNRPPDRRRRAICPPAPPSGVAPVFLQARQGGFSIIAAIFILVVLAGLGAFMVSTANTQQLTIALDVQNSRAAQAARAGIEWGVYQVVRVPSAPGNFTEACNAATYATPSAERVLANLPGLEAFRVEVVCGRAQYTEDEGPYSVYQIVATACNAADCPAAAPGIGYVEHQQEARVKQ